MQSLQWEGDNASSKDWPPSKIVSSGGTTPSSYGSDDVREDQRYSVGILSNH